MKINIPVEIYETDYVLFNTAKQRPIEGFDTIYSYESVVTLFNNGFHLEEDEKFFRMTDLPKDVLLSYAKHILMKEES